MENFEYRLIVGTPDECQKKLNQWKHMYKLKIIQMCTQGHGVPKVLEVSILLTRERNGL